MLDFVSAHAVGCALYLMVAVPCFVLVGRDLAREFKRK